MLRTSSRMLRWNSWPMRTNSSFRARTRARVGSSLSTPARRKSRSTRNRYQRIVSSSPEASMRESGPYTSGSSARAVASASASCSQRAPASRMAGSGCTERSSEARALASDIAPVASSQACKVCSEGSRAFRRETAARARCRSSLDPRRKASGDPESRAAAVMRLFKPRPAPPQELRARSSMPDARAQLGGERLFRRRTVVQHPRRVGEDQLLERDLLGEALQVVRRSVPGELRSRPLELARRRAQSELARPASEQGASESGAGHLACAICLRRCQQPAPAYQRGRRWLAGPDGTRARGAGSSKNLARVLRLEVDQPEPAAKTGRHQIEHRAFRPLLVEKARRRLDHPFRRAWRKAALCGPADVDEWNGQRAVPVLRVRMQ